MFESRLIRALKQLDAAICAAPRETWARDVKARMTWQRETLLPALNQTRDLIEMIENGPYILFDELNGIYYSDIGMTTDKTLAQTYRDIERAEWVAKCSSRYRFKVVKENEND